MANVGSLLVDKYRPQQLDSLNYHYELSARLNALVSTDFPHTLFYGPSGAGKKTRILCVLNALFGPAVAKLSITQRTFLTPSKKKIELNIVSSNYHIELTPSDAGIYDRIIISEILKEIAGGQQIDLNAKRRFKVVIINEADLLSRDAQSALRRTMEKYTGTLRIILCANSTAKIIAPIRSRCLLLRVGAPTKDEISKVLMQVSKKATLSLPQPVAQLLATNSAGNLRRAILSLEALSISDPGFSLTTTAISAETAVSIDVIPRPDWEKYVSAVVARIMSEQSPDRLMEVRGMLYELLVHCIGPSLVLSSIAKGLLDRVPEELKCEIIYFAGFYEHRLRLGSKAIFHLEAFVAKAMNRGEAGHSPIERESEFGVSIDGISGTAEIENRTATFFFKLDHMIGVWYSTNAGPVESFLARYVPSKNEFRHGETVVPWYWVIKSEIPKTYDDDASFLRKGFEYKEILANAVAEVMRTFPKRGNVDLGVQSQAERKEEIFEQFKHKVYSAAKKYGVRVGRWVFLLSPEAVDSVWRKVVISFETGALSTLDQCLAIKIKSTNNLQGGKYVLNVFCEDSFEKESVGEVLNALIGDGLVPSAYKTDAMTLIAVDSSHWTGIRVALYHPSDFVDSEEIEEMRLKQNGLVAHPKVPDDNEVVMEVDSDDEEEIEKPQEPSLERLFADHRPIQDD